MAKLPISFLYVQDRVQFGQEVAAKRRAHNFAKALREGIGREDAECLAQILDSVAQGQPLSVALGFTTPGAPSDFDQRWGIYERVEALRPSMDSYADCYRAVAAARGLSVDRVKRIHLDMRKAHHDARAGDH